MTRRLVSGKPRSAVAPLAPVLLAVGTACASGHGMMSAAPASAAGVRAAACTFRNPVMVGADPSVVRAGDVYYLAQSNGEGIVVYRSDRLSRPNQHPVRVWHGPAAGWNHANVWAPELLHFDGRWYLYYAAAPVGGAPFLRQHTGVLRSRTDDPQGAWDDLGPLYTGDGPPPVPNGANAPGTDPTNAVSLKAVSPNADSPNADSPNADSPNNVWAIDMTVGRIEGRFYAVWSGWERNAATDKTEQHLYIARMRDPASFETPRVRLSSAAGWERGPELDLLEGPEFLQHAGQTFVVYSTRDSWLPTYALGMLRLRPGADPLDPAAWEKSTAPVFASGNGVIGVGHHSTTTSPDGREDWLAYHAKTSASPGWDRVIRLQRFAWRADGSPDFGTPVRADSALPVPSGECR